MISGDVDIIENSLISDANIAVNIYGGFVRIYDVIFNRNNKAIVFNSGISSSTPAVPIHNTIITSRDFALSYTDPNPLIATLKSINSVTGRTYLEGYPAKSLINSNIARPFSGISDYHTYSSPLIIGQIPWGITANNIFDNLDFGVISVRTKTTCVNNMFQFMPLGHSSNSVGIYGSWELE